MHLHYANASWLTDRMRGSVRVGELVEDFCEWAGWFNSTDEKL
jgi:hypothetical protein